MNWEPKTKLLYTGLTQGVIRSFWAYYSWYAEQMIKLGKGYDV